MIDEVRTNLQGYSLRQDRITYVNNSAGLTTSSLSIQVGSGDNLAKGLIEIDDELIWIDSFNKTNNTLNVMGAPTNPIGRGFQGTTAAPHTFNAAQTTYALPDDLENILYVSWQTTGSSEEWLPVNRWRADPMANAATFNTTNTINIYENIQPGRTVQVYYTTTPNTLDNSTDDYEDVTGLPGSTVDVTILGACYKLLSFVDTGRINLTSAEADLNDTKNPYNSGASASRYVFALYQQRLQEEALKLADKYPIRIHYTK